MLLGTDIGGMAAGETEASWRRINGADSPGRPTTPAHMSFDLTATRQQQQQQLPSPSPIRGRSAGGGGGGGGFAEGFSGGAGFGLGPPPPGSRTSSMRSRGGSPSTRTPGRTPGSRGGRKGSLIGFAYEQDKPRTTTAKARSEMRAKTLVGVAQARVSETQALLAKLADESKAVTKVGWLSGGTVAAACPPHRCGVFEGVAARGRWSHHSSHYAPKIQL